MKAFITVAFTLWISSVTVGILALTDYQTAPGKLGETPNHWPLKSSLHLDQKLPTLIMFLHPKCSCSKASIEELNILLTRYQKYVNTEIIFFAPSDQKAEWIKSDLWKEATNIPDIKVTFDPDGNEAKLFDNQTSGHVMLYNPTGELLFTGGITASRGHNGDNLGRTTLGSILEGHLTATDTTFVFGCPMHEEANMS